ncbi:MAG: L-threonylcarbamoyladenylate synthase [Candidatus Margulisiibacteriota bacterium]
MSQLSANDPFQVACHQLKQGKVIIFPTETVYGLGCSINYPDTIQSIYKLKSRDPKNPLQILVSSLGQLEALCKEISPETRAFIEKYAPGPFTFLLYKSEEVSNLITANSIKVGLRIPDHPIALKLIDECGPLVSTSANLSGQPPAINKNLAQANFPELFLIAGGTTQYQAASAVIDLTTRPFQILRPGPIDIQL